MDRNRHSTNTVLLTLHLALLCLVLCLSAGCEEAIVNGPQVVAGPEPAVTAAADLEVVAEAVENTLAETAHPTPEEAPAQEPVVVAVADTANAEPAGPAEAVEAETGDVKVEVAGEADPVVIAVEDIAKANPAGVVQKILAESAQPMPEEASEKEAAAELAERIGLEYPIPTPSLELGADKQNSAADLDKMHIADASLLAEDAKPAQGHEEIQPAKQEAGQESVAKGTDQAQGKVPAQEAESKGFAARFILTPCSAVAGFAKRHWFIFGAAVLFVAGLIVIKKNKLSFTGLRRRMNSDR